MNNTKQTNNSFWNKEITTKELKNRLILGIIISVPSIVGIIYISEAFVIPCIIGTSLILVSALNLLKSYQS